MATAIADKPKTGLVKTLVDADTKRRFEEIASEIGLTSSAALTVFVKRFVAEGGFPFEVKVPAPKINFANPHLMHARVENGVVIAPHEWWDEDDDDE